MIWMVALTLTLFAAFLAWVVPYEADGPNHAHDMEVLARWALVVLFSGVAWVAAFVVWFLQWLAETKL